MAKFTIAARNGKGEGAFFFYDNMTSELLDDEGNPIHVEPFERVDYSNMGEIPFVSPTSPGRKDASIMTLKVQLGLLCNYECSYCNQRHQPQSPSTNAQDVDAFIEKLKKADTRALQRIEFWGGEPLVYWKTLKPLSAKLRALFPNVLFSIITNGALLDREKNLWLDAMGFHVAISHDGPGQCHRGPDPLEDETSRAGIMDLYRRLHPQHRISINAMIHKGNASRAAVSRYLRRIFGDDVVIGEGSVIDAYDASAMATSFVRQDERIEFMRQAYNEIAGDAAMQNMSIVTQRVRDIVDSIANRRPAVVLGQKCSMDRADHVATDLFGNVVTCQNASANGFAPNGNMHLIGQLDDLKGAAMHTSYHWTKRTECAVCPVLQSCKGSCMFLSGPLWDVSCSNAWADHVPFFAAALAWITGYLPHYIEGPNEKSRHDLFGQQLPVAAKPQRKVIPIRPVA